MSIYKVALFDVDGVLIIPPKLFSEQYCEQYGVDPDLQVQFYATKEFRDSTVGKFDLKDALVMHKDLWQWTGTPEELMQMWFEGENYPNKELLDIVAELQERGTQTYLATQQEKCRKAYLQDVVFKDMIDGIFCSCDIGYGKHEEHYWRAVLEKLSEADPSLKLSEVAYFDDRQSLVDMASDFGIDAFLYENVSQVRTTLLV
jgi:putative hydrolase of the HAD superfamily